jgi:hypothetical protein
MPEAWTEERVILALAALRDELQVPDEPLTVPVGVELRRARPRRDRALVAAGIAALATVAVLAVAPAREAVADWLGLGSTEVRIVPTTSVPATAGPSLPSLADGARVVDEQGAAAELGRPLPAVGRADTDARPELAVPVEGGVLVRWPGRDETLWIHGPTPAGASYLKKLAAAQEDIGPVDGLGDGALWLAGPHLLETPGRLLAADHVLLWIDDGLEWRLEGDLPRDEMVAIARNLR